MAANIENQVQSQLVHSSKSFWFTIEGDYETHVGRQRLPVLEKIRRILENLYYDGKICQYVCSHEKGSSYVLSVNIIYLTYVESELVKI
jgi:hypothetical protein